MKKLVFSLLIVAAPASVYADASIHLMVASPSGTFYDQQLTVAACPVTTDPATTTVNGKCALETAGLNPQWSSFGDDLFLTVAGGVSQDTANNLFWGWWQDLVFGQVALNKHELHDGEHLLVGMGVFPLKINVSASALISATSTVTVQEFGFDSSFNPAWNPSSGATVHFGNVTAVTDASGTVGFVPTTTDSLSIYAEKTGFVKSDTSVITPSAPTPSPVSITLDIETATTTIFNGPVTVSACATPNNPSQTMNGFCAFSSAGVPVSITNFSFGIQVDSIGGVASGAFPDSWLWFLNGDVAQVGIDSYVLKPGDTVLWAVGRQPLKISVSTTTPTVGTTYTATVLGFDALAFDFKPVASSTVIGTNLITDASGTVTILATSTDSLTISASASNYLSSKSITVTPLPVAPPPTTGGGGSGGVSHSSLNVSLALSYLSAQQQQDGSYGSSVYSDWAAVAFAAADPGTAKVKLTNYLQTAKPQMSGVTDYERHAMALQALGINPYSGTSVDYITPILAAFDGTQIGDANFDNDDIFALFPLLHAGYSSNDDVIKKTAAFIISKQKPDGSWDGSVDMTGAAIQALGPLFDIPGVNAALGKSVGYLLSIQQSDGGWSNVDSTSWVQTAINGILEAHTPGLSSESAFANQLGYFPTDSLANSQQSDGGVKLPSEAVDNRVWSTAYAVTAASGKSWVSVLKSFPRPTSSGAAATTGGGSSYATTTSATSTSATSTIPVATSTALVVPEVLGASTSTVATSTIETSTIAPQAPAKQISVKKQKKTVVNHAQPVADAAKQESAQSDMSQSETAAQNAGGFFSRLWDAVTSWLKKIF